MSLDVVPTEVAEAVQRAARAVPPHGDLAAVRRRVRAHRHRRTAVGSALAAVAVVASIAVPYALARQAAPALVTPIVPASPAVAPPPAQRLFLQSAGVVMGIGVEGEAPDQLDPTKPNFGYPAGYVGIVSVGGVKEVLADGTVTTHQLGGDRGLVALPDGRLVTLGSTDLAPGKAREDGLCVTDMAIMLRVHGTPALERDIRVMCQAVHLVGATAEEAFLVRGPVSEPVATALPGTKLVAHRFADGAERDVVDLEPLGRSVDDLTGGRAASVTAPAEGDCRLRVLDLASGALVADHDLLSAVRATDVNPWCDRSTQLRLSPDGTRAAAIVELGRVDAQQAVQSIEGWLVVVDVATGQTVLAERVFGSTGHHKVSPSIAGLAWSSDTSLRVARTAPPETLDRIYPLEDVLQVVSYEI